MDGLPGGPRPSARQQARGVPEHDPLIVAASSLEGPPVDAAGRGSPGRVHDAARAPPRRVQPGRQLAAREADASTVRSSVPVVRSSARPAIDPDVGEVDVTGRVQEHRAGDPAVPPLVLVLDVRRVGPLDDAQPERCSGPGAGDAVRSNSEARCESLPTPISSPLRRHDQDALRGPDVEDDAPAGPAPRGSRTRARRRRSG